MTCDGPFGGTALKVRRTRGWALGNGDTALKERESRGRAAKGVFSMEGGGASQIVLLILIFAIMYFLLIRPQQKRVKEHQKMVEGLRRGDEVVTQGGLIGKVVKVKDEAGELEVELAKDVKVRVVRATIAQVKSKTEPAEG